MSKFSTIRGITTPATPARLAAAGAATKRPRRPQLNAELGDWRDLARFRAVAYVLRLELREILVPALALYEKTLTPAQRRDVTAATARIMGEIDHQRTGA